MLVTMKVLNSYIARTNNQCYNKRYSIRITARQISEKKSGCVWQLLFSYEDQSKLGGNQEMNKEVFQYVDHTLLAQDSTWAQIKEICDDAIAC